jgi:hypothetical protein
MMTHTNEFILQLQYQMVLFTTTLSLEEEFRMTALYGWWLHITLLLVMLNSSEEIAACLLKLCSYCSKVLDNA